LPWSMWAMIAKLRRKRASMRGLKESFSGAFVVGNFSWLSENERFS
jgi:hypothetical protein